MVTPITAPVGSIVRIYCNGHFKRGVVIRSAPKFHIVRYCLNDGTVKEVRALIFPEGLPLSAMNWGEGARTAFYRAPDQHAPAVETPKIEQQPRLFD